jgi:hypothetical protein
MLFMAFALLGSCMLLCRPALFGGCMWFCMPICEDVEFRRWGPGEALACAPVQPGKSVFSLLYSMTSCSGDEGGFMMAGPGRMAWLGFVCFSAFWARKARLAWSRRMQLGWSVIAVKGVVDIRTPYTPSTAAAASRHRAFLARAQCGRPCPVCAAP